ncbi:MAG: MFS transporter [Planctomycetaceae bacterium]|nr:MFS transporter [Planctomycetaceae bacterium]
MPAVDQQRESPDAPAPAVDRVPRDAPAGNRNIYSQSFFIAFAANIVLVTANTLSFRFAEFVKFLGGTEEITGRIVSCGLIASLLLRMFAGQAMDRFGVRRVWITAAVSFLLGVIGMAISTDLGWLIYVARGVFVLGLATMFACSVSHVQTLAPSTRRTEIVGTYGASGFLGMIIGAQLADLIFASLPQGPQRYHFLFGSMFAAGCLNLVLALWLTNGERHESPGPVIPLPKLLRRYFPTSLLLVTLMMGLGFSVTTVFLTRYATSLGLIGTRTFFTAYAISAFSMRFVARRWSNVMGRHRMMLCGLLGHVCGHLLLLGVTQDWQLIPPALCCGFGHALLFPCIVSLGASSFPAECRGTATAVTLASVDFGTVLTAPLMGYVIDHYGFRAMFLLSSSTILGFAVLYGLRMYRAVDEEIGAT